MPRPEAHLRRAGMLFLLALACATLPTSLVTAQTFDANQWGADGVVRTMALVGNTAYVGGSFSAVGPVTGGGAVLDAHSAAQIASSPRIAGTVRAAVSDGVGGWFVGGTFSGIQGVRRANIAHILADGGVSPWNPGIEGAGVALRPRDAFFKFGFDAVNSMVLVKRTLYIAGNFVSVGGQRRTGLAAVDARTGAVLAWRADADAYVTAIAVRGRTLYVGGAFGQLAGRERSGLAAVDLDTGRVTDWDPRANNAVFCLQVRDRVVFAGGEFDMVGGQARNSVAAIDRASGATLPWNANLGPIRFALSSHDLRWPWVSGLAIHDGALYIGGRFDSIGGLPRHELAAVDLITGACRAFAPEPDGPVHTLSISRGRMYVGGRFFAIAGTTSPNLIALDMPSGVPVAWHPHTPDAVTLVAPAHRSVFVGGLFMSARVWEPRANLAAFDATTGALQPWNPGTDGSVSILLAEGERLYAGGDFGQVAGNVKHHLAAFDSHNGTLADWTPGVSNGVSALAVDGSTVYVGGSFMSVDERRRNGIAAVDAVSGHVLPWDPTLSYPGVNISTMARVGHHLYVGGGLYSANSDYSQVRNNLAELSTIDGSWSAWNPVAGPPYGLDYVIQSLVASGDRIYVAGRYHELGGQPRDGLAALDTLTGRAVAWDPDPDAAPVEHGVRTVTALAVTDDAIFVGGDLGSFRGQPRTGLAALDPATASLLPWAPDIRDGSFYAPLVASVMAGSGRLYVGGSFKAVEGYPQTGLAAFDLAPRTPAASAASPAGHARVALAQNAPNPAVGTTLIRFALPVSGITELAVYDIQGRRLATPIDRRLMLAGAHAVSLRLDGWNPGVYFYRLRTGGVNLTRRMLVVR